MGVYLQYERFLLFGRGVIFHLNHGYWRGLGGKGPRFGFEKLEFPKLRKVKKTRNETRNVWDSDRMATDGRCDRLRVGGCHG